jgi:hypothetical protein
VQQDKFLFGDKQALRWKGPNSTLDGIQSGTVLARTEVGGSKAGPRGAIIGCQCRQIPCNMDDDILMMMKMI